MACGAVRTGETLNKRRSLPVDARNCLGTRLKGAGEVGIVNRRRSHLDSARQRALGWITRPGKGVAMNELKTYGRSSQAMEETDRDASSMADGGWGDGASRLSSMDLDQPTSGASASRGDAYAAQIARAIEADIIPRLMMVYRSDPVKAPVVERVVPTVSISDVEALAQAVMDPSPAPGRHDINRHLDAGLPVDQLLLNLLAPTARRLGELWTEDRCDFTAVTIGLCRLQDYLRDLSMEPTGFREPPPTGVRVLLSIAPGEQHTFGILMVEEFFRRAGHIALSLFPRSANDLLRAVRANAYDVVGLSASCDESLNRMADLIRTIRRESLRPDPLIVVGGPIFAADPTRATWVGADVYAVDGASALLEVGKRMGVGHRRAKAF